jgi:NADH-ubiquinone oxidoreductase chain 5
MYFSVIVLPLLGSIVSGFFGRKTGVSGAQLITCLSVIITTIMAIIGFFEVGFNNVVVFVTLFEWVDSEWFNIIFNFQFDSLTVSMLIPVLLISSLVHIYSIGYMNGDPHNQRFFSYLSLFTFMMIILVTSKNYLLMFVGWEGVGVCSYLLVSFWFTRIAANQSSISAFLTNRVGDCFLTIGLFAALWSLGSLDYSIIYSLTSFYNKDIIVILGICFLIGAMAKSSQVGLHVWLPMAMEGPTPVSALIHAATMVTAGVYLLMRSSPLIEYSSTVLLICLWLGAVTTVFSSLVGLFQQDIKKVIAYSTMSQLGMMVIAIGLSSYNIALFHLINHAFYKGLLFLGAGAVIHAVSDNQDFRKYGGLISFLPLSYSVILIASLSLVAFPFMTGFFSKDFILESAYGQYYFSGIAIYFVAVIGAVFTTLYSVKVIYLTFLSNPTGSINNYKHAHESDIFISLPLVVLAIFSIFFGFITKDIFIGVGSNFFIDNSLFIHPLHEIMLNTEFAVPSIIKLLPFIFTILFSFIAIVILEFLPESIVNFKFSYLGYTIFGFFNQRFLVEYFYNKYITSLVLTLGGQTTRVLDKGSIESLGPYGLEKGLVKLSKNISTLNTSIIPNYSLYIVIGFIGYLFVLNSADFHITSMVIIFLSLTLITNIENSNQELETKGKKVLNSSIFPTKIFSRIFTKKNLLSAFYITIWGLCSRLIIKYLWDFDIFANITNLFSILYFFYMALVSIGIRIRIEDLFSEVKESFIIRADSIDEKSKTDLANRKINTVHFPGEIVPKIPSEVNPDFLKRTDCSKHYQHSSFFIIDRKIAEWFTPPMPQTQNQFMGIIGLTVPTHLGGLENSNSPWKSWAQHNDYKTITDIHFLSCLQARVQGLRDWSGRELATHHVNNDPQFNTAGVYNTFKLMHSADSELQTRINKLRLDALNQPK